MDSITIDRRSFDRALREFVRETGLTARDVLRDQMRLFIKSVVAQTPPRTASRGKALVAKGLVGIFGRIDDRNALAGLDRAFGHRFWPLQFDMLPGEMRAFHERLRSKSTGRPPRMRQVATIGNKSWTQKPYVHTPLFNRYLRERQAGVGRLKGGWNAAAAAFGFRPGAWVAKHGTAEGGSADTFDPVRLDGFVEAANRVPYSGRHSGVVSAALEGRVRALRARLGKELDRLAQAKSAR